MNIIKYAQTIEFSSTRASFIIRFYLTILMFIFVGMMWFILAGDHAGVRTTSSQANAISCRHSPMFKIALRLQTSDRITASAQGCNYKCYDCNWSCHVLHNQIVRLSAANSIRSTHKRATRRDTVNYLRNMRSVAGAPARLCRGCLSTYTSVQR